MKNQLPPYNFFHGRQTPHPKNRTDADIIVIDINEP